MPGRLTRFLNLERPRKEGGEPPHEVATPGRFAAEQFEVEREQRVSSGIEVDAPHDEEQPFLRCPVCEGDNTKYAVRCINCQRRLDTPEVHAWNARLWEERRKLAAQQPAAPEVAVPADPDAQRRLGELLAQEVALRERTRLDAQPATSVVGMRLLGLIPDGGVRLAVGLGLVALFFAAGSVAFTAKGHPLLQTGAMGLAVTLLALFTPARRRFRSRWWDPW